MTTENIEGANKDKTKNFMWTLADAIPRVRDVRSFAAEDGTIFNQLFDNGDPDPRAFQDVQKRNFEFFRKCFDGLRAEGGYFLIVRTEPLADCELIKAEYTPENVPTNVPYPGLCCQDTGRLHPWQGDKLRNYALENKVNLIRTGRVGDIIKTLNETGVAGKIEYPLLYSWYCVDDNAQAVLFEVPRGAEAQEARK